MWDEAAHSEPTEEDNNRKKYSKCHLCSENKKKTLQNHIIPKLSKFKLCYLCAEKFTAEEKLLKHRLCVHITFVI